jgi:hypothetical protein
LNAQASLEQDGVESEIKAMFSGARFANDAQSRVSSNLALEDGETIELLRNDASFLLISRHADGRTKNVTSWGLAAVGGTMPSDTKQTLMASRIRKIYNTNGAFAAIVDQGTTEGVVIAWGRSSQDDD